ncbi:hypothetical protein AB0F52_09755 [Amycolatopsis sp. NPDC024027]|uniref:hypothetical protein n=1 Tax=Amycolatopsis sp. NPDC024027 TaxID=3154327 RepID=UPI0033C88682
MARIVAAAGRAGRVVVDGFLSERGEAALELLPDTAAAHYRAAAADLGAWGGYLPCTGGPRRSARFADSAAALDRRSGKA